MNIPHISVGALFREEVEKGTALGKEAKAYLEKGELFPADRTVAMYQEKLKDPKGFILDGAPRREEDAEILDKLVSFDVVIDVHVSDDLVVERTVQRRMCHGCDAIYGVDFPPKKEGVCDACGGELYQRKDDTEKTIKHRLEIYHGDTEPLILRYKEKGVYVRVNGEAKVDEVHASILAAIETVK